MTTTRAVKRRKSRRWRVTACDGVRRRVTAYDGVCGGVGRRWTALVVGGDLLKQSEGKCREMHAT